MKKAPAIPEACKLFSNSLITALCGDNDAWLDMEDGFELFRDPSLPELCGGRYYISDFYLRQLREAPSLRNRIHRAEHLDGQHTCVIDSATFLWHDQEIRARYVHHFMIQPHNVLLAVEGSVGYEDILSKLRGPIEGQILFFRNERELRKSFRAFNREEASMVLQTALKSVHAAVKNIDPKARSRAAERLERLAERIRSGR